MGYYKNLGIPEQQAQMTIADWQKKIAEYQRKDKLGTITKEERENWDFMQQKLDDWRSDYEVRE